MKKIIHILSILLISSCYSFDPKEARYTDGPIWPDYMDVTIPFNIAPLNFCYTDADGPVPVTTFEHGDISISIKGREVVWKEKDWKKLLESAKGGYITVKSSTLPESWKIHVSKDEIDYGITYRLIAPGYEVFSNIGIYERNLSNHKEKALLENTQFHSCINCHIPHKGDPDKYSLHIRGKQGGTLINLDGDINAYNTKTSETLGSAGYAHWHPSGDYIGYSSNLVRQSFHMRPDKLIEVYDLDSDCQVYDIRNNTLISAESIKKKDVWETYPSFSADGKTLYFCAATPKTIATEYEQIRYNICSVDFDPATGTIGSQIDTVINAEAMGKSATFARASYDGRFLVYNLADYGNFPLYHREADLWIMDLATGETRPMSKANSNDSESYHGWSTNSRWMMFSSRRDDGLHTRVYFTHVNEEGQEGKAFMLPQKHPLHYYSNLYRSYNIPEFVTGPVDLNGIMAEKLVNSKEKKQFGFRMSD